MAELRWVDGRDYVIEARNANGDAKSMARLATDLAARQPEVVLVAAEASIPALA